MLFSLKKKILLFQEIELPDPKNVKEERALVVWNSRLTNYFKSSPCYLEEIVSKGKHGTLRSLF
jgi:DNA-directed RNA polymerase III subunit RPC7